MDIQILPPEVVNQIAAGEVVERPSFLVKELVENSIDAGATSVEVEADQGGRRIMVRDNGSGIAASDLSLALARHGTSKIKASSDLWTLNSFGFRGEALASVSAVSRLALISRKIGAKSAYRLKSEFGTESPTEEIGGDVGTSILVEELFENVPARLKFLKSEAAELTQIKNTLRAMALSHPEVQIKFKHKGELVFYWPAKLDLKQRVEQILGQTKMYEGVGVCDTVKARVVISSPNNTVKNSKQIWILVQNRWVQDKTLHAAIMDAYRNLLMHREFPFVALWLEVPPEDIDVNIHPTKTQIKFRDSSSAYKAVHRAVRGVLELAPWLDELLSDRENNNLAPNSDQAAIENNFVGETSSGRGQLSGVQDVATRRISNSEPLTSPKVIGSGGAPMENLSAEPSLEGQVVLTTPKGTKRFAEASFDKIQFKEKRYSSQKNIAPLVSEVNEVKETYASRSLKQNIVFDQKFDSKNHLEELTEPESKTDLLNNRPIGSSVTAKPVVGEPSWTNLNIIGQANLTYIICQNSKGIIYIDQHAAHERVLFERLLSNWKNNVKVESQGLLLPLTIDLPPEESELLFSQKEDFLKMGIKILRDENNQVEVHSLPTFLNENSIIKALAKFASDLLYKGGSVVFEKSVADVFASMACHSAMRAGQSLCQQEMESLLEQMDESSLSSFCPHGRPVFVAYTFHKLEQDFGRIV